MSRRDRKPPNRIRRRTMPTTREAHRPLRVTVITSPKAGPSGPALHHEVELLKAALLYADEVELVSPGAAMISSVVALAEGGLGALIQVFESLDDATLDLLFKGRTPSNLRQILPMSPLILDPDLASALGFAEEAAQLRADMDAPLSELRDLAERLAEESGAGDLIPALERGCLALNVEALAGTDAAQMVGRFTAVIEARIQDPRRRVLFDAESGKLARAMFAVKGDESAGLKRAGQAAVGSGMIARLPAFPTAQMDELLDLRDDIADPLRRYRAATISLSDGLDPTQTDTEQRIDDIWSAKVEPALIEIDQTLADHGLVRSLARDAALDVRDFLFSGAGVYTALTQAGSLGGAATVALGAVGGTTPAVARAAWSTHEGRMQARRHELFFLYEANRRLA